MSIIFGSARVDEKGGYSGGVAGDQTGKEVSTQPYYTHKYGWYCLRPKSPSDAIKIANAMKDACSNDNIGYDQANRLAIITAIQKYGSMKKIATKTEADCSSLVRACCMEAGFYPENFTTYNEASILEKTGKFEKKFEVTSETQLYKGDILVSKKKGHTVVAVDGPARKGSVSTKTTKNVIKTKIPTIEKGSTGKAVEVWQAIIGATIDGDFGSKTEALTITFQKKAFPKDKTQWDGVVGEKTWTAGLGSL